MPLATFFFFPPSLLWTGCFDNTCFDFFSLQKNPRQIYHVSSKASVASYVNSISSDIVLDDGTVYVVAPAQRKSMINAKWDWVFCVFFFFNVKLNWDFFFLSLHWQNCWMHSKLISQRVWNFPAIFKSFVSRTHPPYSNQRYWAKHWDCGTISPTSQLFSP